VRKTPVGQILGTVVSNPPGIACGLLCESASASFPANTVVTLTAQPLPGNGFHWTGDCSGEGGPCVLTMDADKDVVLHFTGMRPSAEPVPEASASALLSSRLVLSGGRGEVAVDSRTISLGAGVDTEIAASATAGDHLVEGWVREGTGEGVWRFAFGPASPSGRSIRNVLAGEPVSLTPDAVVFRVRAKLPQKVSFVVHVPASEAGAAVR
jgi:hypothetical protein